MKHTNKEKRTRKTYDKNHTGKIRCRVKTLSRAVYTAPFQDCPTLGMLHFLQVYGGATEPKPLSFMEMESLTCWGERTLKNIMHHYLLKSCLRTKISKFGSGKHTKWLLQDHEYISLPLLTLSNLVKETHYSYRYKQNRPERILHKILDKLYPGEWVYTGDQRPENRIGKLYPDFTNSKRRQIIEHLGEYHHSPDEIPGKKTNYLKHNYRTLFIWESELKNENKVISKIKEFTERKYNAIQNF